MLQCYLEALFHDATLVLGLGARSATENYDIYDKCCKALLGRRLRQEWQPFCNVWSHCQSFGVYTVIHFLLA